MSEDLTMTYTLLILKKEEGFSATPYHCSEGYPTIGYGTLIGAKNAPLSHFQMYWTKELAMAAMKEEIKLILMSIEAHGLNNTYEKLDQVRKAVFLSMCYQLGVTGVSNFKKTLAYLHKKDYSNASIEMLDSLWYRQTKNRAVRHSEMIKTGVFLEDFYSK